MIYNICIYVADIGACIYDTYIYDMHVCDTCMYDDTDFYDANICHVCIYGAYIYDICIYDAFMYDECLSIRCIYQRYRHLLFMSRMYL